MFETVLNQIAAVIETMPVDDSTVTPGLRYDPRGESFGAGGMMTIDMFRRFVFGFPRTAEADWMHGDAPVTPSYWRGEIPLVIFYPLGNMAENLEPVSGMALDDATRLAHHLATEAIPYFNSNPVTDFELMGVQVAHDGIDLEGSEGLLSTFTLRVRYARQF